MSSNCNFDSSKNQTCSADTSSVSTCSHGATSAPETSLETIQETLQLIRLEFAGLSKHLDQLADAVDDYANEPISLGDKTRLMEQASCEGAQWYRPINDGLVLYRLKGETPQRATVYNTLRWVDTIDTALQLSNVQDVKKWLAINTRPLPTEATASPMRRCGICGTGNNFAIYPHEDGSETLMCETCFLDSVTDEGTDEPVAQSQPKENDTSQRPVYVTEKLKEAYRQGGRWYTTSNGNVLVYRTSEDEDSLSPFERTMIFNEPLRWYPDTYNNETLPLVPSELFTKPLKPHFDSLINTLAKIQRNLAWEDFADIFEGDDSEALRVWSVYQGCDYSLLELWRVSDKETQSKLSAYLNAIL